MDVLSRVQSTIGVYAAGVWCCKREPKDLILNTDLLLQCSLKIVVAATHRRGSTPREGPGGCMPRYARD